MILLLITRPVVLATSRLYVGAPVVCRVTVLMVHVLSRLDLPLLLQLLTCRFPARHLPTVPLLLVGLVLILAIPIVVTTLFHIVTRHTQTAVRIIRSSYRPSALDECRVAVSAQRFLQLYPNYRKRSSVAHTQSAL